MGALLRVLSRALPREEAARLAGVLSEAAVPEAAAVSLFEVEEAADLWQVEALYDSQPDEQAMAQVLKPAGFVSSVLRVVALPELDWVRESQRRLAPVKAGRFFLHGRHDRTRIPPGSLALELEAGQAFGTGHHGTTKGCLLALQDLYNTGFSPRHAVDVGTGSGVLAMAMVRLWRIPVIATDIDATALKVAVGNLRLNHVLPLVRLVLAHGVHNDLVRMRTLPRPPWRAGDRRRSHASGQPSFRAPMRSAPFARGMSAAMQRFMPVGLNRLERMARRRHRRSDSRKKAVKCLGYDLVVANILAGPLREMACALSACVTNGGRLVLSGLLIEQEAMVLARYGALGFVADARVRCEGWSTLVLRRNYR